MTALSPTFFMPLPFHLSTTLNLNITFHLSLFCLFLFPSLTFSFPTTFNLNLTIRLSIHLSLFCLFIFTQSFINLLFSLFHYLHSFPSQKGCFSLPLSLSPSLSLSLSHTHTHKIIFGVLLLFFLIFLHLRLS